MYAIGLVEFCAFMYLRSLSLNKSMEIMEAYHEKDIMGKKSLLKLIEKLTDLLPDHVVITETFKPNRSGYYAFDGTWFKYRGRDFVLLVCFDVKTLDIVAYKVAVEEDCEAYKALIKLVPADVLQSANGFFADGELSLLKVLRLNAPSVPLQLCVFHKYSRVGQLIPFKRGNAIDREIKTKVSAILFARTKQEAENGLVKLERYASEHEANQKLQAVIGVLKRNFDLLLTHFDHPEMSPYNNVLEGFNHIMKTRIRLMKGFKKPINISRWIKLILLDYRFHKLKECSAPYKERNGKCPLELAGCELPKYYNWVKFLRKKFKIKDKKLV